MKGIKQSSGKTPQAAILSDFISSTGPGRVSTGQTHGKPSATMSPNPAARCEGAPHARSRTAGGNPTASSTYPSPNRHPASRSAKQAACCGSPKRQHPVALPASATSHPGPPPPAAPCPAHFCSSLTPGSLLWEVSKAKHECLWQQSEEMLQPSRAAYCWLRSASRFCAAVPTRGASQVAQPLVTWRCVSVSWFPSC